MKNNIPQHVAIVCDGNRRWARSKGLPVFAGHKKAVDETFEVLIDQAIKRGVKYLTFWIFSTENWDRDKKEIEFLMNAFRRFFDEQIDKLNEKQVRFKMIGRREDFAEDIQERIEKGEEKTKDNQVITVTLAMSYGGRDELLRGIKKMAQEVRDDELAVDDIDRYIIAAHLDTAGMPDPDFIIRTSGEQRLSGFLLWQMEYAEFYFPEFSFPDFTAEKFDEALEEFSSRKRRFGK
jgi:undecaprenyl diphosphate synthase